MFEWISANIGTVVIALIVIAVITLVVIKLIRDRKKGKPGCSCGCSGCPMKDSCHK